MKNKALRILYAPLYWTLYKLLQWHITHNMDQGERWQLSTKNGDAFIRIDHKGDEYNWNKINV